MVTHHCQDYWHYVMLCLWLLAMHVVLDILLQLVMLQELTPPALLVVQHHRDNTILDFNAPWERVPIHQVLGSTGALVGMPL